MGETLLNIPIVECEEAGDSVYLLPTVRPVLHVPPEGFTSLEDRWHAEMDAITEAYVQAAKRGEVGVIKNVGFDRGKK